MIPAVNRIKSPENITGISKTEIRSADSPVLLRDRVIHNASEEMGRSAVVKDEKPEEIMQTVVAAGTENPDTIDSAHDFNLARVLELLSDPLLQEDIPGED